MNAAPQRRTWDTRVDPEPFDDLLARVRASDLPLDSQNEISGDEVDNSKITALISVIDGDVEAYIATPSGHLFRMSPGAFEVEFEPEWWPFALRNYYIVTGNMVDRLELAAMADVDPKTIKGRCVIRRNSTKISRMTLGSLFDEVCPAIQDELLI